MKSIVEEASSIFKAVEKAWERAGKPADFSVKIFEDSQRSFFGLTKKQAKIGLFFAQPKIGESHEEVKRKKTEHHSVNSEARPETRAQRHNDHEKKRVEQRVEQRSVSKPVLQQPKQANPIVPDNDEQLKKRRGEWTPEMLKTVETWVLSIMRKGDLPVVPCSVTHQGNRLQVTFERSLFDDLLKNTALFRSLSYLLLGMVRSRYKKEFRFLKIVLTTHGQQVGDDTL